MHLSANSLSFFKMHGTGNDFVLFDCRPFLPSYIPALINVSALHMIAHRQQGIGCDQTILILPPQHNNTLAHVRFFNADGSESDACGNGARCAAWILKQTHPHPSFYFSTNHDTLHAQVKSSSDVEITMGKVDRSFNGIPFSRPMSTSGIDVGIEGLPLGYCASIGNPHIVFFVDHFSHFPLESLGPTIAQSPLFLQGINVHLAIIESKNTLRLQTWERGSGMTLSCGSGACVTAAIAAQLDLITLPITIHQKGGTVSCSMLPTGEMTLAGPTSLVFQGEIALDFLTHHDDAQRGLAS